MFSRPAAVSMMGITALPVVWLTVESGNSALGMSTIFTFLDFVSTTRSALNSLEPTGLILTQSSLRPQSSS